MFGSELLDTAIGLMFVYLLLSLSCSTITEGLARLLALRAENLRKGIDSLLLGDEELIADLNNSPFVTALSRRGPFDKLFNREARPSYLPARTFGLALLSLASKGNEGDRNTKVNFTNLADELQRNQNVKISTGVLAVLRTLADTAGGDVEKAQKNIEQWYNSTMDRIVGWYKRKTGLIVAACAIALCGFLNADTIAIAKYLLHNETVRELSVAAGTEIARQGQPGEAEKTLDGVVDLIGKIEQTGLPLGWNNGWPDSANEGALKVLGLIITMLAVSLGTPFWFDALNRIVNLRDVGKSDVADKPTGAGSGKE